jgi:spore coat polysaccharide biosynthesis protein SpsF
MSREYQTEQEGFWAGEFGDAYIERNVEDRIVAGNTALFSRALGLAGPISTVVEFGANIGLNLRSLGHLYPDAVRRGVEINAQAAERLRAVIGANNVYEGSILDYSPSQPSDLVLIKGVLIHINPDVLEAVYDKLYAASSKYVLVCEYYNPSPVTVNYRGHENRLFKRDFAGEMLDRFADLRLIDYGFVYRRDPSFPLDDITWFLLKK